jgi:hypothetical protein
MKALAKDAAVLRKYLEKQYDMDLRVEYEAEDEAPVRPPGSTPQANTEPAAVTGQQLGREEVTVHQVEPCHCRTARPRIVGHCTC